MNLVSIPFKDNSNHLHNSYDATSKCDWANVISENPFDSSPDWALASGITGMGEVPNGTSSGHNELTASYYECVHPEEAEQVVNKDVTCLFFPSNSA